MDYSRIGIHDGSMIQDNLCYKIFYLYSLFTFMVEIFTESIHGLCQWRKMF